MAYPKLKEDNYCSHCDKKLDFDFLTIRYNFLVVKFFEEEDGSDNMFCSSDCLANSLSADTVYID